MEIPTACILSGINVPDHADFFRQLKASLGNLDKSAPAFVASVKSKDCGASSIKSFLRVAVAQIVASNGGTAAAENLSEDDSDEEENKDTSSIARKMSPRALRAWYRSQTRRGPIVFILEDFEGFHPSVLRDLVHNVRCVVHILA